MADPQAVAIGRYANWTNCAAVQGTCVDLTMPADERSKTLVTVSDRTDLNRFELEVSSSKESRVLDTLDQQAGNVIMLRRVSYEQIEISHRAGEHVRGRGVCSGIHN